MVLVQLGIMILFLLASECNMLLHEWRSQLFAMLLLHLLLDLLRRAISLLQLMRDQAEAE